MQYLTRPDGSVPPNVDIATLESAGVLIVRPTPRPAADPGMVVVEGPPENKDGVWWQTWIQEAAPLPAPPQVPPSVSLWQFRAALRLNGNFERVQYALAQLSSPENILAAELFEYGNTIYRTSALATELIKILGVTDEQVDALFIAAADIRV
jgi:hypothetical protein